MTDKSIKMLTYGKNTSIDGHPITKNGEPMSKDEIIKELNFLASTVQAVLACIKCGAFGPGTELADKHRPAKNEQ